MLYMSFTNFNVANNKQKIFFFEQHFPNLTTNRLKAAQILWKSAFGIPVNKIFTPCICMDA